MKHKRPPRSSFVPLKISANLQCGVLGDTTLPFDALLYYIIHRDKYGRQDLTMSGEAHPCADQNADTHLPLARLEEHGPMWYYAASWAQWGKRWVEGSAFWTKRLPLGRLKYLDGSRSSVDIASGRYKAHMRPVFYRHALEIYWYVLGEPERIGQLLPFLTHIGKKPSQGWGAVNAWQIERIDKDFSVRGPHGQLMRPIPADRGTLAGFRPSYWLPKNQTYCELPEGAY